MRVAVITTNNPRMYSGGRYHSLGVALALSSIDSNEVYFVTNNKPIFYSDFQEQNSKLNLFLTQDFMQTMPKDDFDIVILVPHQKDDSFYPKVKLFALERNAKLVLINFESGNWFNQYSSKDLSLWNPWKRSCEIGCLMLSISQEGNKYAKEFYTEYPELTQFDYWYPQINNLQADKTQDITTIEKRILILGRLSDKHKGGDDILELFDEKLAGFTIVFLVGSSVINKDFFIKIQKIATLNNITLEFSYQLSDHDKFIEYRKASVLVFPSYFEGYGYPPVEAMYCNTPVIAYDLPVLREVTNNGAIFVERGNKEKLKNTLVDFVQGKIDYVKDLQSLVFTNTNFAKNTIKIDEVLKKYLEKSSKLNQKEVKSLKKQFIQEINDKSTLDINSKSLNYYLKKIYRKLKPLPNLLKYNIKQDGNFFTLKGFFLTSKHFESVKIIVDDKLVISINQLIKRPDVLQSYSQYENITCGFELSFEVDKEKLIFNRYKFIKGVLEIEF